MRAPNLFYFVVLLVAMSSYSCRLFHGPDKGSKQASNTEQRAEQFLERYQWKLIQINRALPPSSPAYLDFQFNDESFHGNAGCNRIVGTVQLKGDSIHFSKIASTEMACLDESLMQLESTFLSLLNTGSFRFDIADQTLNLYDKDRLVLMFGLKKKNDFTVK